MGQASHIQNENKWDLEETIRQAEQKFTTDLKTIATETTNDEKLLKTLVCLERRTLEQIPDEYKTYYKQLSTRFGVVFYDDRIIIPKSLRTTIIMLLHKGHAAINKMTTAAKPFWWPRMTRDIQQKCDVCFPCKMAGKNIKPQIPMTEINYLPPVEKTNQEIQLDFIGPKRSKHRRFYILLSIDRYSRWPAACICESPTGKTAKNFLEQYITLNGLPQTIRTDKGTAFTGKEFREICKSLNIKLIYGTPYIHTPTGLVERGIRTLKEYLRKNLEEGYNINEALSRSLNVMRTTVHSSIKETPFERHYGRKPRMEIHNYLNISPNKHYNVSARPETLQVYTFTNGNGAYDQLVMKAPRKLKEDVSNKFPYLFLEKKQSKEKFESAYENKPQTAVAGTKHTITTDKNKITHRKRISKPLNPIFQNPLSRRGENPRGKDGRFLQQGQLDEDTEEQDVTAEHSENWMRRNTPPIHPNTRGKHTGQNTGNGEYNNQSSVRQRTKKIDKRQKTKHKHNTRIDNKPQTNYRRRPKHDNSSRPKR